MSDKITEKLKAQGIKLPQPTKAVGNYVPCVKSANMIYVSGQITMLNGEIKFKGRLGDSVSLEEGVEAARLCGLNLIAQLSHALDGQLDRINRVVKLNGFVNSDPQFFDQPKVINGASDLMVEVFGDLGIHSRSAVGVAALPLGVAVEIDGIFEFA